MHSRCLVLVIALALPASSAAQELDAGAREVEVCLRRNLPAHTSRQDVRFESRDRMGGSRRLGGEVFWKRFDEKRSRSLIRIDDPPDLRGSAYLLIERDQEVDIFVYLPDYKSVRRITPHAMSGSLFGTDFSYEDMRRLRHLLEHTRAERLPDAEKAGRRAFALRLEPPPESRYGEVRAWVDAETCVPLELELVARGGALAKVLSIDAASLTKQGERWTASRFTLRDLEEQTETRVELGDVHVDGDLPDRLFTERALAQGN